MGKDKKKAQQNAQAGIANVGAQAQQRFEQTGQPSALENEMAPVSQNYQDLYGKATYRQMGDYGDIMSGYDSVINGEGGGPTSFSWNNVSAKRPEELGEAYGYLREAAPGYREFANTGGYSAQDIQELRARGVSPIRAAYGNTIRELDRSRAIGGGGGAANYIAARSRAQRELPQQMADATTNVNAGLAESIREGKLKGLAGLSGIGDSMGGLSSAEAGRILQADLANSQGALQAAGMSEQSRRAAGQEKLAALSGKTSLYGTTPAMSAMFGNQALQSYGLRSNMEQSRNQYGLGLLGAQMSAFGPQANQQPGTPWWQTAMKVGGTVAPYLAKYYGSRGGGDIPMEATDMYGEAVYG